MSVSRDMPNKIHRQPAAACLLLMLSAACADPAASPEAEAARGLFDAVHSGDRNAPPETQLSAMAQDDPSWPTAAYLLGETDRRRGDIEGARTAFQGLAAWAASDPYGDTWGGSGLAIVGLWRWLQILDEHGPASPGEVDRALDMAEQLRDTRLYSGMVQSGLLPGLPLVAEDVAHRLTHVAWKHQRRDRALDLYLDFLAIDSRGEMDDLDRQVQAELLREGLATRDRLDFFRARRQLALVKTEAQKDEAARTLKKLWDDRQAPADLRAEAGYEWANHQRQKRGTAELVQVLSEVIEIAGDGPVAAVAVKALYRRGIIRGGDALIADMAELRRRFPRSPMEDEALYQLATAHLFKPDLDRALAYYGELRGLQGPNDYQDSAWFLPALGLVGRNRDGDLDSADRLLADYLARHPDGAFRVRSLFWRGRIAERQNDAERARGFFQQVIGEAPYGYYGLRARLHLDEGVKAIGQDLPAAGSQTRAALAKAWRDSRVDAELAGSSPYHRRLQAAASPGFYERLLAAEFDSQKALGKRLDDIPLEVLDARGLMPAAALLLSLRQDALAARDFDPAAGNRLQLAGLLGHELQDWPAAGEITVVGAAAPRERLAELQADPRYLATVYPDPAQLPRLDLEASLARAAWPMGGSQSRSQSVMYALIRQESRFYAGAISTVGALGLLQIMPATFARLDERSQLLQASGAASDVEYLLDPRHNIATAAGWWKTEFGRDELPVAVMKHNAGIKNVSKWTAYWEQIGCGDDLEYRVETIRFRETANFLRGVLTDTAIVEAAGFFEEPRQLAAGDRS